MEIWRYVPNIFEHVKHCLKPEATNQKPKAKKPFLFSNKGIPLNIPTPTPAPDHRSPSTIDLRFVGPHFVQKEVAIVSRGYS